jgi:uncharacterized protein RhaS with RHS repeats
MGHDTTFGYDSIGRRTSVTDHQGNVTSTTFDAMNRELTITGPDPDGKGSQIAPVTTYTRDGFGRVTKVADPNNGNTAFTYDVAGNLLTLKDPVNNTTTFDSDCTKTHDYRLAI